MTTSSPQTPSGSRRAVPVRALVVAALVCVLLTTACTPPARWVTLENATAHPLLVSSDRRDQTVVPAGESHRIYTYAERCWSRPMRVTTEQVSAVAVLREACHQDTWTVGDADLAPTSEVTVTNGMTTAVELRVLFEPGPVLSPGEEVTLKLPTPATTCTDDHLLSARPVEGPMRLALEGEICHGRQVTVVRHPTEVIPAEWVDDWFPPAQHSGGATDGTVVELPPHRVVRGFVVHSTAAPGGFRVEPLTESGMLTGHPLVETQDQHDGTVIIRNSPGTAALLVAAAGPWTLEVRPLSLSDVDPGGIPATPAPVPPAPPRSPPPPSP